MSALPSASGIGLAMKCVGSVVLPRIEEESGPEAQRGTRIHRAMEKLVKREAKLAELVDLEADESVAVTALWKAFSLWFDGVEGEQQRNNAVPEVALAYDLRKRMTRVLGVCIGRAYPETAASEVVGTADVMLRGSGQSVVVDWKVGRVQPDPTSQLWQMRTLALMAARWSGDRTARAVTIWAPHGANVTTVDAATFEALDIDLIEAELVELLDRITDAHRDVLEDRTPQLALGSHCSQCRARLACPARVGLIRSAVADAGKQLRSAAEATKLATAEELSAAWSRALPLIEASKELETAFREAAKDRPFVTKPGYVLGLHSTKRERLDPALAVKAMEDLLGPKAARVGIEVDVTKAGVDRAIRARVAELGEGAPSQAELRRDILDRLRREGGVKKVETTTLSEHRRELPPGTEVEQ